MKNITYEWCIEFFTDDEYADITELNFSDTDDLNFDINDFAAPEGHRARLCLVRKMGNDAEGETHRWYASVNGGKLPEKFNPALSDTGSVTIPKKYHKQLSKFNLQNIIK